MAKLKGICKNIDCCDLAADKVEQEAEKSNFVCSECGKPLTQVGGGKGSDPNPNKKLLIIIIAAVVLIGGGAGAWFGGLFGGSADAEEVVVDTTTVVDPGSQVPPTDTVDTDSVTTPVDSATIDVDTDKKPGDGEQGTPEPAGPKFSWGKYSGPAEGFGGELKVTREHSIDLGNTRGEVIDVYPGDVIKNIKISNGKIVQGVLIRTDGTQKTFTIGV